MEFTLITDYSNISHDSCLIGGFFEQEFLFPTINTINTTNNRYITELIHTNRLTGKKYETLLIHYTPNILSHQILLLGCGQKDKFNKNLYKKLIHLSIQSLQYTHAKQLVYSLHELNIDQYNNYWKIRQTIEIIQEILYNFEIFKKKQSIKYKSLKQITFYINNLNDIQEIQHAIQDATIITENIKIAKNLANMPPNICNPKYLISQSKTLEETYNNITTTVIDEKQMKKLGMNAYISVGQASKNTSLMSIIKYNGHTDHKKQGLVLIGKGVTFDSGGLSIKSSDKMDEMKYDMCGAASVYAIMHIAAQLHLPINIIGILATSENMISKNSLRPGDILKTLSGQTVEIKNTDAEGRLILCDVITYVTMNFNPKIIIDIATLTGACVIALGHHFTGLMSNNDILAHALITAGEKTDDRVWRLPLNNEFQKQINSNIADMTNTGGYAGSAITAGCFLERFTNKYPWAHLDIAGTAWQSNETNHNATGRPISMLTQFLIDYTKIEHHFN